MTDDIWKVLGVGITVVGLLIGALYKALNARLNNKVDRTEFVETTKRLHDIALRMEEAVKESLAYRGKYLEETVHDRICEGKMAHVEGLILKMKDQILSAIYSNSKK